MDWLRFWEPTQGSVVPPDRSRGMEYGIEAAKKAGRNVVQRCLFPTASTRDELDLLLHQEYEKHDLPSPEIIASIYGRIIK